MNTENSDQNKDTVDSGKTTEENEPCMRCGKPVEIEGDMLCRKCEGEVH